MEEQTVLPLHSTTNSNTKAIVVEQETSSQKRLSFSIDSILDKQIQIQQQQQQPLFNCSNFKIKRHHHSTPIGTRKKPRLLMSCPSHLANHHRSSNENGNNNDSGIHLLLIDGNNNNKRKHSGSLSSDEHSSSPIGHKHVRLINTDDDGGSSDCSGITTSDVDEDDIGSGSEDNETNHSHSNHHQKYSHSNGGMNSYHHHGSGNHELHEIMHRKKKTRTVFSRTQIFQLETTFDRKRYLSSADRANLAQGLRLTEQQVKVNRY